MNFTVVRAVRGADLSSPEPGERLRRVNPITPPRVSPAGIDLPYAEEVLRLELSEFAKTIPGGLE